MKLPVLLLCCFLSSSSVGVFADVLPRGFRRVPGGIEVITEPPLEDLLILHPVGPDRRAHILERRAEGIFQSGPLPVGQPLLYLVPTAPARAACPRLDAGCLQKNLTRLAYAQSRYNVSQVTTVPVESPLENVMTTYRILGVEGDELVLSPGTTRRIPATVHKSPARSRYPWPIALVGGLMLAFLAGWRWYERRGSSRRP